MAGARHIVSPTPFLNNRKRCLADRNSGDDQILAIVLRNPLKKGCHNSFTANMRIRQSGGTQPSPGPGVYDGFEEWITHFLQLKDRQQTMATSTSTTKQAKQAFSCYNPGVSEHTLSMSCRFCFGVAKNIHLGKHVIQHLVNFVGIADLYVESLCLLHFSSQGSVPQSCACGGVGPLTSTTNITHGVPRPDIGDLPRDLLKKASSLIQQDVQLFAYALERFEQELRSASKSTGVQMVCEDRLRKLWDQIAFTL